MAKRLNWSGDGKNKQDACSLSELLGAVGLFYIVLLCLGIVFVLLQQAQRLTSPSFRQGRFKLRFGFSVCEGAANGQFSANFTIGLRPRLTLIRIKCICKRGLAATGRLGIFSPNIKFDSAGSPPAEGTHNMANTTSAKKAARQAERRTLVNKSRRSRMRTFLRKVEEAIASGDKDAANLALREAQPEIMRSASKGIIHRIQHPGKSRVYRLASRPLVRPRRITGTDADLHH